MQGGAWGITLATAHQTRIAYEHGVRRVLMGNQLVGRQNMAIISDLLRDPSVEYFCLVDSPENVEQLGTFFRAAGQRLQVLIELGADGGRTGVRDDAQLKSLLAALDQWRGTLSLSGVEFFEGVFDDEALIRSLAERAVHVTGELLTQGRFDRQPALLTGAGSAWYDVVAEVFSGAGLGDQVEIVLRPGCYLTHDVGSYRRAQERILAHNPIAQRMHSGLVPALQVWAYVQSVPEKEKAIVSLGKRDAAFDAGLPSPALHYRPGSSAPVTAPAHWSLTRMMDQHAFLQIHEGDDIRVGDMIGFDISHPCLTFDKWQIRAHPQRGLSGHRYSADLLLSAVRQHMDRVQPLGHTIGPSSDGKLSSPQAITVPTLGVDVQLRRNIRILELHEINRRVLDVHRIILRLNDETGRSLRRHMNIRIRRKVLLGKREIARIHDHGKIRATTQLVSRIHRIIQALIEMRAERCGEVRSR